MDNTKKTYYENVFVVLTYRNIDDLEDFLKSVERFVKSYKVIIINSYYDDSSKFKFATIAKKYSCDFINVPNKGYSVGNNYGIEYARKHYQFRYLIVSNPDILIRKFELPKNDKCAIYCGEIKNLTGKAQNPMLAYECKISEKLVYKGLKYNRNICFYMGVAISKVLRRIKNLKIYLLKTKISEQIFAAHGSFLIFTRVALDCLNPVFDENIFLFSEEHVLAKRAKQKGIPIIFLKSIACKHKEDGSMKLWNGDINEELKKSVIYCFERYCNK